MSAALHCRLLGQSILHSGCSNCKICHIHATASQKCPVKAVLLDHLNGRSSHKSIHRTVHSPPCAYGRDGRIRSKDLQDIDHIADNHNMHARRSDKPCQLYICSGNIQKDRFVIFDQLEGFRSDHFLLIKIVHTPVYYVSLQRILL